MQEREALCCAGHRDTVRDDQRAAVEGLRRTLPFATAALTSFFDTAASLCMAHRCCYAAFGVSCAAGGTRGRLRARQFPRHFLASASAPPPPRVMCPLPHRLVGPSWHRTALFLDPETFLKCPSGERGLAHPLGPEPPQNTKIAPDAVKVQWRCLIIRCSACGHREGSDVRGRLPPPPALHRVRVPLHREHAEARHVRLRRRAGLRHPGAAAPVQLPAQL